MHARGLIRIFSIAVLTVFAVVGVAVVSLHVYQPSLADGFTFSAAGKTIRLSDGRTLAYVDTGDPEGRPVFYFHGGPGSRLEGLFFDELSRQLGIRIIAPDRPGYGLSDIQEGRTYLDWPRDIGELADQLGIERFAVLGWSSGGPYAAAVAHEMPQRLAVVVIVAGEGPYASDDFPRSVLTGDTFSGSGMNRLLIWSANHSPWLMRSLFKIQRILLFKDPAGLFESYDSTDLLARDRQFFLSSEYIAEQVEAFRQGVDGLTRDTTIERLDWPFKLEDIQAPTVLMFHGGEDKMLDVKISDYMRSRIPTSKELVVFPGEGHSVIYHRYREIALAMIEAWD